MSRSYAPSHGKGRKGGTAMIVWIAAAIAVVVIGGVAGAVTLTGGGGPKNASLTSTSSPRAATAPGPASGSSAPAAASGKNQSTARSASRGTHTSKPTNPASHPARPASNPATPGNSPTSPAGSPSSPASKPTTAQSSPSGSSGGGSMYIPDIDTLAETINLGNSVSRGTEVDGGVAPYTWSITGLPPGITQQPQATGSTAAAGIVGTADVAGTYHLTVAVTDSEQPRQTLTEHYTFVVLQPNSEVWGVIGPGLASGTVGVPFSASFIATNGVTATFSVSSGEPPPGISLNSTTGVLAGTPTERGIFTFDIVATNVATGATKQAGGYNFQVNPAT
jgi:large repetitive protein